MQQPSKVKVKVIPIAVCAAFFVLTTAQAMAQSPLTPVLEGLGLSGNGSGDSMASSPLSEIFPTTEPQSESSGAESDSDSSSEPLPGLAALSMESSSQDNGAEDGNGGFGRHDGAVIFRDEERNADPNNELRNPSVFLRYTLSEDLQSVRGCAAAGEICRAQTSIVFREFELTRLMVGLNGEEVLVLPPPEEESTEDSDGNGDSSSASSDNGGNSEQSSGRHDGLLMVRDEERNADPDNELRNPSIYVHYTLSDSLQSVRTCTAAGDTCRLQASVVFRDGEIERVRLFDELIIGEEFGEHEDDTGEHDPPH